jgi:hypothetical protein
MKVLNSTKKCQIPTPRGQLIMFHAFIVEIGALTAEKSRKTVSRVRTTVCEEVIFGTNRVRPGAPEPVWAQDLG